MPLASDWTTSVLTEVIQSGQRRTLVAISGAGTMSYNSTGASGAGAGLPLPVFSDLGMRRNVDYINIVEANASGGRTWKYDRTLNSLRLWTYHTTASIISAGATTSASLAVGSTDIKEVVSGVVVTTGPLLIEVYGW